MAIKTIMTAGGEILRPDQNVLGRSPFGVFIPLFQELGAVGNTVVAVSGEHSAQTRSITGMAGQAYLDPVGTAVGIH